MSAVSLSRGALGRAALILIFVTACRDAVSPPTIAARGFAPRADASVAAAPSKSVLPTGTGFGINNDPNPPQRTKYRMDYHDNPVLRGPQNLYFIWYGDWSGADRSLDQQIVSELAASIGNTPYLNIAQLYSDLDGNKASSAVIFGGGVYDAYSHGSILSENDIKDIPDQKMLNFELPADPQGIYVVVSSPDVAAAGQGISYCATHGVTNLFSMNSRFIYIGGPARSPLRCSTQPVGPNGTLNGDGMAYLLAAELANVLTDPFLNAWYDRIGLEVADKCAWSYGTTFKAANGSLANVHVGARDYLLPPLWVPSKSGGACALHW